MDDKPDYKALWRSRTNKKIAGICGGLGEYFKVDPFWLRILFVVFTLAGGGGAFFYILIWILVPLEPRKINKGKKVEVVVSPEKDA